MAEGINPDPIAAFCDKAATTTLAQFRDQAAKEFNGTRYDCIRAENGPRVVIFLCLTGQHEIEELQSALSFPVRRVCDWSRVTLIQVFMRATLDASGLAWEVERDADGRPTAIFLVAVKPQSIQLVESVLHLPE